MAGTNSIALKNVTTAQRKIRRPQHTFQLRNNRPWYIQPFMLAPVLHGETMRNLLMQTRIVTDPVANPIIGWWAEHYFYYVKLRDLDDRTNIEQMLLDPTTTYNNDDSVANGGMMYELNGYPQWAQACWQRVVQEYFRLPEDAAVTSMTSDFAKINGPGWLDSVVTDTDWLANQAPDQTLTVGGDDSFTMKELEDKWLMYQHTRAMGLLGGEAASFDEWLMAQGINVPGADQAERRNRPELIRFARNWQYPSNTIDPSTGTPTSAVSWSITERADKDRYFTEPGFIFGVVCCRPKIYLSKQQGSVANVMEDAKSWLPDLLAGDASYSFKKFANTAPLLASQTDAYWVDIRDLFLYGDQWLDFTLGTAGSMSVALPSAALQKRFPATTDMDNMFATTTAGVGKIKHDGVVTMMISSRKGGDTSLTTG